MKPMVRHAMISIATNVVPSLVGVDFEFEAFVWVGDLTDFVFVVDEEAVVISMRWVNEDRKNIP